MHRSSPTSTVSDSDPEIFLNQLTDEEDDGDHKQNVKTPHNECSLAPTRTEKKDDNKQNRENELPKTAFRDKHTKSLHSRDYMAHHIAPNQDASHLLHSGCPHFEWDEFEDFPDDALYPDGPWTHACCDCDCDSSQDEDFYDLDEYEDENWQANPTKYQSRAKNKNIIPVNKSFPQINKDGIQDGGFVKSMSSPRFNKSISKTVPKHGFGLLENDLANDNDVSTATSSGRQVGIPVMSFNHSNQQEKTSGQFSKKSKNGKPDNFISQNLTQFNGSYGASSTENSHEYGASWDTEFRDDTSRSSGIKTASSMTSGSEGMSALWREDWSIGDVIICPNLFVDRPTEDVVRQQETPKQGKHERHCHERETRVPRMFHKRLKPGYQKRPRLSSDLPAGMMNSPLMELFKIVQESGLDISAVLESAEYFGLPFQFPCMQCFEGRASRRDHPLDTEPVGARTSADRCQKCGGQVATMASMGRMIDRMRKVVAENDFVVHDVYPDGNCVFGTVIDQLRVRGDFRYTIHSLRGAVVDYLRKHPNAEDGTPLEMFLTNETWEAYLYRMSQDGQWGDHMVFNAMTHVLQTEIYIYGGGVTGEARTVLKPQQASGSAANDPEPSDLTPSGHNGSLTSVERSGAKSSEKPEDSKTVLSTAMTACKNKTEEVSAKSIHLGHFGESHYVSLRPRKWRENIIHNQQQMLEEWQGVPTATDRPMNMICPLYYLDFLLKHTMSLQYINSYMPHMATIDDESENMSLFEIFLVGPVMCKMVLDYSSCTETVVPDVGIFLPSEQCTTPSEYTVILAFQSPKDTRVVENDSDSKQTNLIFERVNDNLLTVRLKPVSPQLWGEQVILSKTGQWHLKTFNVQYLGLEGCPISYRKETLSFERFVAFKCDWPEVANDWLTRVRPSSFPDYNLIQTIVSLGCHVVSIVQNRSLNHVVDCHVTADMVENQVTWCLSFAVAEKCLSKFFTDSQRQCYLILSAMIDFVTSKTKIPVAVQKSVFFHACEMIEKPVWQNEPGRCLVQMLLKLHDGLQLGFIPHYFLNEQNLLQDIPNADVEEMARVAGILRTEPISPLFFVLDKLNITSTEIGALVDDVLEDIFRYNTYQSKPSASELFSAGGRLIENLVYQGEYEYAKKALHDMHDHIMLVMKQPVGLAEVMKMLLGALPLGYQWCLGFYIDLTMETTVTIDLTKAFGPNIHITEVFGQDTMDEMPNTIVPACYSIEHGDLKFPQVACEVLLQAGKPKLITKSLKYYLETYASIAGDNLVMGQCPRKMKMLQSLYVFLLETYIELNTPEEFRCFMPTLTKITEMLQDHGSFEDLASAWQALGEPKKAAKYNCNHCHSPMAMIRSLTDTLKSQTY